MVDYPGWVEDMVADHSVPPVPAEWVAAKKPKGKGALRAYVYKKLAIGFESIVR